MFDKKIHDQKYNFYRIKTNRINCTRENFLEPSQNSFLECLVPNLMKCRPHKERHFYLNDPLFLLRFCNI